MLKFSADCDVLRYEPILWGDLHLPWQVLSSGNGGVLSGTVFCAEGAEFLSSSVEAGGVVYLRSAGDGLDGAFEIVSVDSETQLTVSVLRASADEAAIAPPCGVDIFYRISTLRPQIESADFELTEYLGIRPGNSASELGAEDILDKSVLKQASVFSVISGIYAMLADSSENEGHWKKSLHYRKLFEKARQRCRLSFDVGSDGVADVGMVGGSFRLIRD